MLGRNASQPTGFHLRHCTLHHVFWLHLFALYWRGRWISHYSDSTVLWISVQVPLEYSQITKITESNLSLKTTRQNLTTVARISQQPSLIRSPPGWYRNGAAVFAVDPESTRLIKTGPEWSKVVDGDVSGNRTHAQSFDFHQNPRRFLVLVSRLGAARFSTNLRTHVVVLHHQEYGRSQRATTTLGLGWGGAGACWLVRTAGCDGRVLAQECVLLGRSSRQGGAASS